MLLRGGGSRIVIATLFYIFACEAATLSCPLRYYQLLFSPHESCRYRKASLLSFTPSLQLGRPLHLTLLTDFPHLAHRFDEVVPERDRRRLGARALRLDSELDDLVPSEVCYRLSAGDETKERGRNAQLIPYPSGQTVPNPAHDTISSHPRTTRKRTYQSRRSDLPH